MPVTITIPDAVGITAADVNAMLVARLFERVASERVRATSILRDAGAKLQSPVVIPDSELDATLNSLVDDVREVQRSIKKLLRAQQHFTGAV